MAAAGKGSRRSSRLWAIGALLAAAVVFGNAQPAAACSCAVSRADALADADAVFTGVLESQAATDDGEVLFTVDEVFAGRVHARQWVVADDPLGCGPTFGGAGAYLVVASGSRSGDERQGSEGAVLHTHSCMGNSPLVVGLPDGLGPPSSPLPGTSPAPEQGTPTWQLAVGVAVAVAVVAAGLAGVAALVRRRRQTGAA